MKVTLPTATLVEAVGHGAAVAASKSPKPVLECVALKADETTGVVVEATDLDVGVRIHLPDAEVAESGVIVVPAARLLAVAREVEDEATTLTFEDGNLIVETGRSRFTIRGEDPDAFPVLPEFPDAKVLEIPGDILRRMIRRTVFATAKEAGRYALHGVLFKVEDGRLELVATDGRRLARSVHGLEGTGEAQLRVIVGPKGLSLLDRTMGEPPRDVTIALGERQVLFQIGGTLVISRLIDGTFPAYEDVIPKGEASAFELGVTEFAGALRRASLLTTRDAISVHFDIGPQLLTIRSRAPEIGEARVEVPVQYDGGATHLGFNPNFLVDALKVMDPEGDVRFEFRDGKAPGKLTDGDDYVYVVMPIALE